MAEQERDQTPKQTPNPAEVDNVEVTELEDKDIEEVSGGYADNCSCSNT
jgi:hypothetical protein